MAIRRALFTVLALVLAMLGGVSPVCRTARGLGARCTPPPPETSSCRRDAAPCRKAPPAGSPCQSGAEEIALAAPEKEPHHVLARRVVDADGPRSVIMAFRSTSASRRIEVRSTSPPLHLLEATFRN